jgi:hypothetical protein
MSRLIDLTGRQFGRLTVLHRDGRSGKNKHITWLCRCDCGKELRVRGGNLRRGNTQSCGCLQKEVIRQRNTAQRGKSKSNFINIKGQRFGRLMVLYRDGYDRGGKMIMWRCRCDCGIEVRAYGGNLRHGLTRSCGCLGDEMRQQRLVTHGDTRKGRNSPLYGIWRGMRDRCNSPRCKGYRSYGGRGIKVCPEWADYSVFKVWAIAAGYDPSKHIHRVDNDGPYAPWNCVFIPPTTHMAIHAPARRKPVVRSDGRFFAAVTDAGQATNISYQSVSLIINGKMKTAAGFGFKRIPKEMVEDFLSLFGDGQRP